MNAGRWSGAVAVMATNYSAAPALIMFIITSIMKPKKYGNYFSAINCGNTSGKNYVIFKFPRDEKMYVPIISFLFQK